MFERICLQRHDSGARAFDAGTLAESLLFYQDVTVVVDRGSLNDLIAQCHPLVVLSLMEEGDLKVHYVDNGLGVHTENSGTPNERHDFGTFSITEDDLDDIALRAFLANTRDKSQAKSGARRFTKLATRGSFPEDVSKLARAEIQAEGISARRLKILLTYLCPDWSWKGTESFDVEATSSGLIVNTTLDFPQLNQLYHQRVSPKHSTLSPAYLLSLLFSIQGDLFLSSSMNAELATTPLRASLIQSDFECLVRRRLKSAEQLALFQSLTLSNAFAIREAINSGKVSFPDIRQLIRKSRRFKQWLAGKGTDSDLIRLYYSEVTKESWVDKLPTKSTRWGLFMGAGLLIDAAGAGGLGTAANAALSAFDTFFLDKIVKGWRPDQFVEEDMKKAFIGAK